MAEKGDRDSSDEEPTIADDVVVTKYKMAGEIANRVLRQVLLGVVEGSSVLQLCETGDKMILEETGKIYKKEKEFKKGIAFPTCVSLNNCVCNFSPLRSDSPVVLKDRDLVKVELGVHVDGFIAVVGHTTVVGCSKDCKVTGRKADVMMAAHYAAEIAHRMLVPGGENMAITGAAQKAARAFNCCAVEGILSHQLKKNSYENEKSIILNPTEAQKKDQKKCEFELHEAYLIDILVSTGEGKTKQLDTRTTVYKKTDEIYNLKMKASRAFYSDISAKFSLMPFTLRACEEESKARMGVVECLNHNLVQPFGVLYEKDDGEFVAQCKFTVLLMPNGPQRITSGPFDPEIIDSSLSIEDPELKALLATSASRKNKKKKKKAKANGSEATTQSKDSKDSKDLEAENPTVPQTSS